MMTNKLVVILSLCLLINGFNFLVFDVNIIRNEFFTSNLVYLISSCLLLRQFDVLPDYLWNNYPKLCTILELPLSILLLELFLYAWLRLQEFIILNSDFLLVWLSDKSGFNWFFCHFCCDCVRRCPDVFANLVMQATSFAFLFSVCSFLKLSLFRNRIERTASKRWRGSLRRIVAATVYNLSCFTHGCSTGWVSGVLGSEALTGGAWLAALPCLVALPAAPFFAVLADVRGRKAGAFCICVSFIISWSLAAWCGPRGVWAARVAAGAGGAGALALAPIYGAEIAPRTRGLAAIPALACSAGILFAYCAGGVLSSHALSLSMVAPPAVLLTSLLWLPETPSYLISVGRIQDAAKIICWFDGSDFREDLTDVIEQQEVRIRTSASYGRKREAMRRQDSDTFQPMLKRVSGLDSTSTSDKDRKAEQSACRELFRHRRSRRALFSCIVILCAAAGSGAGAVNSFATAVLRHSVHAVPRLNVTAYNFTLYNGTAPRSLFDTSEAGSILCGAALVLGAAVATLTVDKLGRKMLLLCSCTGITCCLAVLGVYCDPHLQDMSSWYLHRLWPYRKEPNSMRKLTNMPENNTKFVEDIKIWNNSLNLVKNFTNTSQILEKFDENVTEILSKSVERNEDRAIVTPIVLLSLVLFLYNIGLGSVPYVLISELFTINVRGFVSSLLISWMWLSNFLLLRYYGTIAVALGLHGAYYISASITFLGAWYIFLIVPETKGKSQQQIEEVLDGPWIILRKKRENRR